MDLTSALKSEIFRPLVTVIVPGSVAVAPYVLVLHHYYPITSNYWDKSPTVCVGILLMFVIAAGLILEDVGSWIEERVWAQLVRKKQQNYDDEWKQYLQLFLKDEMIGHRYLRTLLVRMKFELSMGPGLLLMLVGLMWYTASCCSWAPENCFWLGLVIFVLMAYMFRESYQSVKVLGQTRSFIIESMRLREERRAAQNPRSYSISLG